GAGPADQARPSHTPHGRRAHPRPGRAAARGARLSRVRHSV
ncbi:MAG: hypothetical protein AVDCRST_MAG40-2072, partial [uncultured Gemmatimonadaceae bacterium]